jgi:parallel beta-helix repeat protein
MNRIEEQQRASAQALQAAAEMHAAPEHVDTTRRVTVAALALAMAGCGGGGAAPPVTGPAPMPVPPPAPSPTPSPPEPAGRTWYIDPAGGDDAFEGSVLRPRRSLPTLAARDRVLLRRGTTLVVPGDYDPRADDVSFDAYLGSGDPASAERPTWTLSGRENFVIWTGDNEGLAFRNIRFYVPPGQTGRPALRLSVSKGIRRGVLLEDCDVIGDDGALVGLLSAPCAGLTVRRCVFACARASSFAYGASGCIFIKASEGTAPFSVTDMLWEDNRITSVNGPGLQIRSGSSSDDNVTRFSGRFINATLRRNRVSDCATSGVFLRCGFHAGVRVRSAAEHYGWDGLMFEDNVVENNGGSGVSIGPNTTDSTRRTTIQRNRVWNNGRRNGTTGGLQLMGLNAALIQDNDCRGNWTTSDFDGVNLFLDVWDEATLEMQTTGARNCVVTRNYCAEARGAGGSDYAAWLAEQNPNSSNAPSSGIRLYFARGNAVFSNVLVDNGSGIACDKSADNVIFNNTVRRSTMGFYEGVGMGTRGNVFANNVSLDCDWDFYGLGAEGWSPVVPTSAEVVLDATDGSFVRFEGDAQFAAVRFAVGGRNFFIRESADDTARLGLAVISWKSSDRAVNATVLRPFSALRYAAGALAVGSIEPPLTQGRARNARHGARVGSLREQPAGLGDILADPLLDTDNAPQSASPLRSAGTAPPPVPFGPLTDAAGRPFESPPSVGAFQR